MDDSERRVCKSCGNEKDIKSFPRIGTSKYRERRCYTCRGESNKQKGRCAVCFEPAVPGKSRCEEHLELLRQSAKKRQREDRRAALMHYTGSTMKCQCPGGCDVTEPDFLTIEHINGGGNDHRREIGGKQRRQNPGGGAIYRWLRQNAYPTGFTVLCYNCNCSKGANGTCPHTRK